MIISVILMSAIVTMVLIEMIVMIVMMVMIIIAWSWIVSATITTINH